MTSVLDKYPLYETNIGIEVHVQLTTKTKIFCGCANTVSEKPNSFICQICSGYPGVLPVLNKEVVKDAVLAGIATNCTIAPMSEFARKHYFYPDLPKNYQITQADRPIAQEGFLQIRLEDGSHKKIRLIRIHIEEDAGKNIHSQYGNESFVDLNRAGTPLLEIVSHPDISSSYEAREYLKSLRAIVQYLGICSGNMEEGAFRADTNISVRKKGSSSYGTKCELKNINSFKFIGDAIEYEIERQINLLESGKRVIQETRLWNPQQKKSIAMRSKEEAADYRYLPDPDLPLIAIDDKYIENTKALLPELPEQKFERFVSEQGLTTYEAEIIVNDIELSNYYEKARQYTKSKLLINWILRNVMALLKEGQTFSTLLITPEKLAELVELIEHNIINNTAAQEVFAIVAQTGQEPKAIVKEKGLEQIGSPTELEEIIKSIIQENQTQVNQYKAGNQRLWGFFVGLAMQKTKGRGNPQLIQELLKKYLS